MKTFNYNNEEIENKAKEYEVSFNDALEIAKIRFYREMIMDLLTPVQTTVNMKLSFNYQINEESKSLMNEIFTITKGTFASKIISDVAKNQKGIFTPKQLDIIINQLAK